MDDFAPATTAEHLLWSLARHGVEHLFLNPGTDSAPLQEAAAVLAESGVPLPRIITCSYESVALAAAHGYWQATGRAQCVFVHVDVGTQNLGAMMHNAMRDRAGVVVIAGRTPYGEEPDSPGGRSHPIQWMQDVPDQAGVVRGYTKWSAEITRADALARTVGRAVQVARGGNPGPTYLMVGRDVLMDPPRPGLDRTARYAVPTRPAADGESVAWVADRLLAADRPLLITSKVGRRAEGFAALSDLADLTGVRVIDQPESGCLNIATTHPARVPAAEAAGLVASADLIVLVDTDVPWVPKRVRPRDDTTIVQIEADPVRADMPLWTFPVDLAVTADGATALRQIAGRLRDLGHRPGGVRRAADGRDTDQRATGEPDTEGRDTGGRAGGEPLTARTALEALNLVLRPDDIVVEEAVTNAGVLAETLERTLPGTLLGAGYPGLGWGLPGAVGISLAAPEQRVIAVVGDGSFMFAVPTAALCLAAEARAPVLVVILNNNGYRASRLPVFELFPDGLSAARGDAVGTRFQAPPDFAALARACHAHGETVTRHAELLPALRRGLESVESGRSAVIDVLVDPS